MKAIGTCGGPAGFLTLEKCLKMRSARIPFSIRAIMKKFIYACNETHYILPSLIVLSIQLKYEQSMNEL